MLLNPSFSRPHVVQNKEIEIPRSMVVEALSWWWWSRRARMCESINRSKCFPHPFPLNRHYYFPSPFSSFSFPVLYFSRAYAFGREMVCSQKSVRNRNFFENAGYVSFSYCQTGSAETHTKPCKTSPQGTSIKRPAIYWDHAVSWGGGVWVSVSDIGRVSKKIVLRRIPIYFLSTIFHDLPVKPKLASFIFLPRS